MQKAFTENILHVVLLMHPELHLWSLNAIIIQVYHQFQMTNLNNVDFEMSLK